MGVSMIHNTSMNITQTTTPTGIQAAWSLLTQGRPAFRAWLNQHADGIQATDWLGLGMAHMLLSQWQEAQPALERSLALDENNERTLAALGAVATQLGDAERAVHYFDRAVALAPGLAGLWADRSRALHAAGRFQDALESVERALSVQPNLQPAWLSRGTILRELGRYQDAIDSLQHALRLAPGDVIAWNGLADTLFEAERPQEAADCAAHALTLAPQRAELWLSRGSALMALEQWEQALEAYEHARALDPDDGKTWVGCARALKYLSGNNGYIKQALKYMEQGLIRLPHDTGFVVEAMYMAQKQAFWERLPMLWQRALERIDEHNRPDMCFTMLSNPQADGHAILRGARAVAARQRIRVPQLEAGWPRPGREHPPRPRIGYLSGDFNDHPVSFLMTGVFEAHDKSRFEVFGIDVHKGEQNHASRHRARIEAAFGERLVALGAISTVDTVRRIRELKLDVLIDLMGVTGDGRMGVLLRRPAPLQVMYLGFPGSSGMEEMDYILADRHVAPPGSEEEFAEHVVRLPDTFQPNDRQRTLPEATPPRAALGLPGNGFVFCCHCNTYKINPGLFDIWCRLLAAVPGSVLWLVSGSEFADSNLRAQAVQRGIAPERLVFAPRCGYADYLARYRAADLFLDTLPFNGGTTCSDALWAGLPVLTQTGCSFAGRMATSLLHAVGAPELVTANAAEYEARALHLARHPEELRALRERLETQRLRCPLFDTTRFTRHLEWALEHMCERRRRGLPPAAFDVPAL